MAPNLVTSLDAATAICLHIGRQRGGANQFHCYLNPKNPRNKSETP